MNLITLIQCLALCVAPFFLSCATEHTSIDPDAAMLAVGKSRYAAESTPIYHEDFTHEGKRYRLRLMVDQTETHDEFALKVHLYTNAILWEYNRRTKAYDLNRGGYINHKTLRIRDEGGALKVLNLGGGRAGGWTEIDGYAIRTEITSTSMVEGIPMTLVIENETAELQVDIKVKVLKELTDWDEEIIGAVSTDRVWSLAKDPAYLNGVRLLSSEALEEVRPIEGE